MTDGLKLAAGPALERILARSTGTRVRGLASGVAITGRVQSSLRARILGFQDHAEALLTAEAGEYDIHDMERCLRRLSRMRRLAEQALKAAATLQRLNQPAAEAVTAAEPQPA